MPQEEIPAAFTCRLPFAAYRLHGPDATRYLQGRCSQDVYKIAPGILSRALLLDPTGHIQACLLIGKCTDGSLLLLAEGLAAENLTESLLLYKVADRLSVETLCDATMAVAAYGGHALTLDSPSEYFTLPLCGGSLMVYPFASLDTLPDLCAPSVETASSTAFERFRLVNRLPLFGVDITETLIGPQIPSAHCVSFAKGCYVGQEVMGKAASRGRISKRLYPFTAAALANAAEVEELLRAAGAEQAQVTSIAHAGIRDCHCGFVLVKGDNLSPEMVVFQELADLSSPQFPKTALLILHTEPDHHNDC